MSIPVYQFKLSILGGFSAHYAEQPEIQFVSQKEQELLSYLVLRRERSHEREFLAGLLWADTTTARSKKYLRTELWRLRSNTAPPSGSPPVVMATKKCIGLNPEADVWSDASVLESTFDLVRNKSPDKLTSSEIDLVSRAVNLFEGPLLEGWYPEWCQFDRERFHQIYMDLVDKLIASYEVNACYDAGIELGLKAVREDPTRERTHRRLMRLYFHAGDRASALEQYCRCASILRENLSVDPSVETRALYQQLRIDSLEPPTIDALRQDSVDLEAILRRVEELGRQLDQLRGEIENNVARTRRFRD